HGAGIGADELVLGLRITSVSEREKDQALHEHPRELGRIEEALRLVGLEAPIRDLLEPRIAGSRAALVELAHELHLVVVYAVDTRQSEHRPRERLHLIEGEVLFWKELGFHATSLASLYPARKSSASNVALPRMWSNRNPGGPRDVWLQFPR